MNGALAEGVVPQLLREMYVRRQDGWLHLVRAEERHSLQFRRGHIVNARTNVAEERLGEMLVRRGRLAEADFLRARQRMLAEKRRLGEVLIDLGLLDADGLEDAVALHVHEMLTKVFSWTDGSYSFEPESGSADAELTLKLSTGELILEAVQAVHRPEVVHQALGDMDRVLALSSDPLLRFQTLSLSPTDGFVLSRIDGVATAREIVQMIPLPTEDAERSLFALVSTGVIEYVADARRRQPTGAQPAPSAATAQPAVAPPPPPKPQPVPAAPLPAPVTPATPPPPVSPPARADAVAEARRGNAERRREIEEAAAGIAMRSHFEVLGVARTAGETEIKEAYFRLARRFHPDVHHDKELADLRDSLEAVFIRLGQAYEVLRDPRRRGDYERRLGRPRAEPTSAPTPPAQPATEPASPAPRVPRVPTAPVPPAGPAPQAAAPAPAAAPQPPPAPPAPAAPAPPPGAAETRPQRPRDAEEDAHAAEEALRRAMKLFEAEKYWDAIQLLEPAVDRAAGRLKSKAKTLLARCYLKNPKWSRRAEEALLAVTQSDPGAVDAWALLGEIYASKQMHNRAVSMYRKVLELSPGHPEAARYLAGNLPDEGTGPVVGGVLRRLFRRS